MKKIKTKHLKLFLKSAVSLTLLFIAIRTINYKEIQTIFNNVDIKLFILALILNFIGTIICKAYLIAKVLSSEKRQKLFIKLILTNLSLRFYTIVLPRPAVAAIRWYKYSNFCTNAQRAFTLMIFESLIYIIIILIAAIFFIIIDTSNLGNQYLLIVIISLFIVITLTYLPFLLNNRVIKNILHKINLPKSLMTRFLKWEILFKKASMYKLTKPKIILTAFLFSILSFIFFIVGSYILAKALNLQISFVGLAWIRPIVMLLTMIPITIAGIGIRETSLVHFLSLYRISPTEAVIYSISTFFLQLIIAMFGGITELFSLVGKNAKK